MKGSNARGVKESLARVGNHNLHATFLGNGFHADSFSPAASCFSTASMA